MGLYPYQQEAVDKMKPQNYFLLADEMGLGKTVSAIGFIQQLQLKRVLVVVPANIKHQWKGEIEKYAPELTIQVIEKKEKLDEKNLRNITICSYHKLIKEEKFLRLIWDLVILDEVDTVRNWKSQSSQTVKHLRSFRRLGLTGTPFHNRIQDLFSIYQFLNPGLLGNWWEFREKYLQTRERKIGDRKWLEITGYKNLDTLKATIRPYFIRRTKKQVGLQLPPVTYNNIVLDNEYPQLEKLLQQIERSMIMGIRGLSDCKTNDDYKMARGRIINLQGIFRLATNSVEILRESKYELGEIKLPDREFSPKLDYLDENIEKYMVSGNKILIFTCFYRMALRIAGLMDKKKLKYFVYSGELTSSEKVRVLEQVADCKDSCVMISTDAGAFGLNLQFISTIIHYDLPWDPAVLSQRNARANRIGQQTPLEVVYLTLDNSFDRKISALLVEKSQIATEILENDKNEGIFKEIEKILIENI